MTPIGAIINAHIYSADGVQNDLIGKHKTCKALDFSSALFLSTMVRTRFVPVPESDTEIIEEEITQHQTKRGISIKTKRTPMTQSLPTKAEKPSDSRSKSKKKAHAPQTENTTEMAEDVIPQIYEPDNDIEYQPDDIPAESQPLANVCQLCTHIISFICSISAADSYGSMA